MKLLAEVGGQGNGLGAAVDLLVGGCAVAVGVVSTAVEGFAASTGAQGVAVGGEGVAPFTNAGVSNENFEGHAFENNRKAHVEEWVIHAG